jgi:hypothetical protein
VLLLSLLQLGSAANRYIIKLKRTAIIGTIAAICNELSGKLANTTRRNANVARRFQGICNMPLSTVRVVVHSACHTVPETSRIYSIINKVAGQKLDEPWHHYKLLTLCLLCRWGRLRLLPHL